jgi:predicted acetyltransferase
MRRLYSKLLSLGARRAYTGAQLAEAVEMNNLQEVILQVAAPADAAALSNLVQLYAYDLSEIYSLELQANGLFPYDKLSLYWSQPEQRFALFIRHGAALAGFALVTRGSPASDDPEVHDVAEFFVVRRHRRFGVGREAAVLLWDRFPVRWSVRVSEANVAAQSFWSRTIADYAGSAIAQSMLPGNPRPMSVFSFDSLRK